MIGERIGSRSGESVSGLERFWVGSNPTSTAWIGVPDPDFGSTIGNPITATKQEILSPWTTNTSGWYYCTASGTNSGNGYPADPKGIGSGLTLAAGDVLVLSGTFTGSTLTITCNGTEANPVWIINDGTVDIQRLTVITGTYAMVDGLNWSNTEESTLGHGTNSSYICVRNGTMTGDGAHTNHGAGYSASGTTGNDNSFIVFHNMVITGYGDYTSDTLIDKHAIKPRNNITDHWITGCTLYRNGGDGVQTGEATGVGGTDRPTRIYIAGNTCYENRENSFDIKASVDVVMSQNNLYGSMGLGDSGPATEIVIHGQNGYEVNGAHVLFNRIHDTYAGIVASSYATDVYVVGNIFHDITGATSDTYYNEGVCINLYASTAGDTHYIHNNTFYNYDKGISVPNDNVVAQITGNLFSNRTGAASFYYDIGIDATGGVYYVAECDYNLFEDARFRHDGSFHDGLTIVPGGFEANSIEGTIAMTSPATGDFTLTASSDAINNGIKGDAYALYQTDFGISIEYDYAGDARPATSGDWDIGAYEYSA